MHEMSMLAMGVMAVGLLGGGDEIEKVETEKITLTIRNHETGKPLADVQVTQSRSSKQSEYAHRPVATKQTDTDGKAVFEGNPARDSYCVDTTFLPPQQLHFDLNGKGVTSNVERSKHYHRGIVVRQKKDDPEKLEVYGSHGAVKEELTAYVGTYTGDSGSKGIYRIRVGQTKGIISKPELVAEIANPSFLASDGRYLYAVSESLNKLVAYDMGNEDGMLTLLNEAETGKGPCHVVLSGHGLTVADYGGGSVGAWHLRRGGLIGDRYAFVQHTHASQATGRQQHPHAHGTIQMGMSLLVPDLGADRVYVYDGGGLPREMTPNKTTPWLELPPGRGPRHAVIQERAKWDAESRTKWTLYVLNELSNSISVFEYDFVKNTFSFVEEVSTLPAGFTGESFAAELIVQGNTLYSTNRGHDSIARFQCDPKTGRLTLVECVPCGGKWPRHFTIMPGGSLMLVANQNSNNIAVFRIGKEGALTLMPDAGVDIGAPACVVF